MRDAARTRAHAHVPHLPHMQHLPHITLNTDGRHHPVVNTLSLFTLTAGIVAMVAGFIARSGAAPAWHVLATWLGLIALVVGLYTQLISATRPERMLIVTGLVAAFVGVALGLAKGGLLL